MQYLKVEGGLLANKLLHITIPTIRIQPYKKAQPNQQMYPNACSEWNELDAGSAVLLDGEVNALLQLSVRDQVLLHDGGLEQILIVF